MPSTENWMQFRPHLLRPMARLALLFATAGITLGELQTICSCILQCMLCYYVPAEECVPQHVYSSCCHAADDDHGFFTNMRATAVAVYWVLPQNQKEPSRMDSPEPEREKHRPLAKE
jgi:hypothetical protein